MVYIKEKCIYCKGTGDYRGLQAVGKSDYKSKDNICYHCNGLGSSKTAYETKCKYCGSPCNGHACMSCLEQFESEKDSA